MSDQTPSVRPVYRPLETEGPEAGTLVLRDGSRAELRQVLAEDRARIRSFLRRLSEAEREEVMRSLQVGDEELGDFLAHLSDRDAGEAFFVTRSETEAASTCAFGAYRLLDESQAALTLAVAPEFRQQGIASLLLERLAVRGAQRGVQELVGIAHVDNEPLAELFRTSGFEPEKSQEGDFVEFVLPTSPGGSDRPQTEVGNRVSAAGSLQSLFRPRSVAVVGASRSSGSLGRRLLEGLVRNGFQGPVYPVNPKADYVSSVPAFASLQDIGRPVDLAVIVVPQSIVSSVVDDCLEVGVKALIVITAGYAETGEEGKRAQAELVEKVRRGGMRMVGPNCLGLINMHPEVRLNASFSPTVPSHGKVAMSSQSGALGVAVIARARELGLGLSSFVSVGNKADVSGNDLLQYWEEDPATEVILLYVESFGNPRRFARIARRVARRKPIVAVKSGRTKAGSRAASSHTAALSSSEAAVEALFEQTGIIRADTLDEMFGLALALAEQPLPPGRRVAILTNAGGPGILCTDALVAAGLEVPELDEATQDRLQQVLPAAAAVGNPVDMIASAGPEAYRHCARTLLEADEVDALVIIYTPVNVEQNQATREAVVEGVEAARRGGIDDKPVFAAMVGAEGMPVTLESEAGERIPVYPFPEAIGSLLGKIAIYAESRRSDPGVFPEYDDQQLEEARQICRKATKRSEDGESVWLGWEEMEGVLSAAGLELARGGQADSRQRAIELADGAGYPVAVKLASRKVVHKTDVGGVHLGLNDAGEVGEAWDSIARRMAEEGQAEAMDGVVVQPMLSGNAEIMIGVSHDPSFGPLVGFGLGGIHVEILRDVVFRVAPLTDRDARRMVREIKGYKLLEGYRGHPAADIDALTEALLRVSRLVEAVPEIREVDFNPVFALGPGEGYRIVDSRIQVAAV